MTIGGGMSKGIKIHHRPKRVLLLAQQSQLRCNNLRPLVSFLISSKCLLLCFVIICMDTLPCPCRAFLIPAIIQNHIHNPVLKLKLLNNIGFEGKKIQSGEYRKKVQFPLFLSSSSSSSGQQQTNLPEISTMKIIEIRKELESYGISTKSFLEKKEMINALENARKDGKIPKSTSSSSTTTEPPQAVKDTTQTSSKSTNDVKTPNTQTTNASSSSSSSSKSTESKANTKSTSSTGTTTSSSDNSTTNKAKQLSDAMKTANAMKVSELRKELQALGIETKSFFEKSEFVKAYAEAIISGKQPQQTQTQTKSKSTRKEEPIDPTYRDVIMQKMGQRDPRILQGTIIDIKV